MADAVLFERHQGRDGGDIAIATLNSEKSLNALTLDMIRLLHARLREWEADPSVACVLLRGSGEKAFCAGGDVRAVREALLASDVCPNPAVTAFFAEEYALDHHIHRYGKPVIAWGHGIVMGGGLGLMAGASHRVATPQTRIAMPEISIGLYPDVAGSWFLQRMPGRLGLFLALTATPLNAHDALFAGLADHVLSDSQLPAFVDQLAAAGLGRDPARDRETLHRLLAGLAAQREEALPPSPVIAHFDTVQALMHKGSLADIAQALCSTPFDDPWLVRAADAFKAGSPTSAALSWEIWQRARHLSLKTALEMELVLSVNVCAGPDFREGVRALLVDKDRQPRWQPATLADVDPQAIARLFISPWDVSPLRLAPRSWKDPA